MLIPVYFTLVKFNIFCGVEPHSLSYIITLCKVRSWLQCKVFVLGESMIALMVGFSIFSQTDSLSKSRYKPCGE